MTNYDVLGITADATLDEITYAYHTKALECHPNLDQQSHYATLNQAFNALTNPLSPPLNDSQLFSRLLDDPHASSTHLFRWGIYLACTNKEVLDSSCDAILNHQAFNDKTYQITRAAHYLLQQLLPTTNDVLQLSAIQPAELILKSLIINNDALYTMLSDYPLKETHLTTLHEQFKTINAQKRLQTIHSKNRSLITNKQNIEIMNYFTTEYNRIDDLFLELKLKNEYHRSILKSISLFACYQKSKRKVYFCHHFITEEFNRFSIDDKKQLIKQLINEVDQGHDIQSLKTLLIDNLAITIDVLFNLLTQQIQQLPIKPFYSYHSVSERQIANAQKQLKTDNIATQEEKIQWIQTLAADYQGCFPVTFFRSHQVADHSIILYCKKWTEELGLQIRLDAYDPMEAKTNV